MSRGMPTPRSSPYCFLGNSGVGKSTLINALVSGSETVVPSGGIGPLTAQALTVRFAEQPRFEAEYHPLKDFWQLGIRAGTKLQERALSASAGRGPLGRRGLCPAAEPRRDARSHRYSGFQR